MPCPQVREATAFLLEALAGDKADEGPLQTKLLEINLITNPQVRGGDAAAAMRPDRCGGRYPRSQRFRPAGSRV
jgi:hypothetical protein